jgi:hypothetical protein
MEKIKQLRLEIDKYINSVSLLQTSREVSLAFTNLQRAKMWLGRCLTALGDTTPYTQADNSKNDVIENQAEHTSNDLAEEFSSALSNNVSGYRQTTLVKEFRSIIQKTLDNFTIQIKGDETEANLDELNVYLQQSKLALEEAKMWLGLELDAIRTKTGRVQA